MGLAVLDHTVRYLEHLTSRDFEFLAEVTSSPGDAARLRASLLSQPRRIEGLLEDPLLFERLTVPPSGFESSPSPFLTFGVLVNRARRDLEAVAYVSEWSAPGKRLPVFDASTLSDFIESETRRYFVIETLTSFTRIASGVRWIRTRKGYRRKRFSELDLLDLAELVDDLPQAQRPGGYRRLGDVALFLSGIFPDHSSRNAPEPGRRDRLARMAAVDPTEAALADGLDFYAMAGAGWYRQAAHATESLIGTGSGFLSDMADRFDHARRFLNHLADRYLYRVATGLTGPAG